MQARPFEEGEYRSFREMLERLARIQPDHPAFSGLGEDGRIRTISFAALYEEVSCLGDGLLAAGLGQAHVAIVSRDCSRYAVALLSALCGSAVVVPLDARAPQPLLEALLERSDAVAVLCDSANLSRVLAAQRKLPRLRNVIILEGRADGVLSYDGLLASGREPYNRGRFLRLEPDPDAMRMILFSSGTTGTNKGVMLSPANLLSNVQSLLSTGAIPEEAHRMSLIPLHHAACIAFTLMSLALGMQNCFCGDLRDCMTLFRLFRPERIQTVPLMIESFYRQIRAAARKAGLQKSGPQTARDLFGGRLRSIACGGAALRPELIRDMYEAGIVVHNLYGTTECGPGIAVNADTAHDPLTVGPPLPGLEIRLDDPDEHGAGTLCVRGKSIALGYYKDPDATRAVFGPDGFFNTGDSVRITEDGRILHLGRKASTLVLPSGENLHPQEIEQLIASRMDFVTEAVVYLAGLTLGKATREVLCAGLYIPDPDLRADRARIAAGIQRINQDLPAFARIDYIELPDTAYPRTTSLKLRRTTLPQTCSGDGILLTES